MVTEGDPRHLKTEDRDPDDVARIEEHERRLDEDLHDQPVDDESADDESVDESVGNGEVPPALSRNRAPPASHPGVAEVERALDQLGSGDMDGALRTIDALLARP